MTITTDRTVKARYPIIADPDNTDINQLYLDYAGPPDTSVRAGRQSIKFNAIAPGSRFAHAKSASWRALHGT